MLDSPSLCDGSVELLPSSTDYPTNSTKVFDSPSSTDGSVELLPSSNCYDTVKKFNHGSSKDTVENESEPDIYALTYKDLRKLCKDRGLNQGGTKDTLIHRLIAISAAKKNIKSPPSALRSFTIQTLERRSNSSKLWNDKCCSANSEMVLSLYICQNGPHQVKYILGRCGCAKEVLKGWAVKSPSVQGKLLHFWIADNNHTWKNYPCEFRAEFDTLEDAHEFMDEFEKIVVPNAHIEEPSGDEDFVYQSQQQM